MEISISDLIQLGIFIVALVGLLWQISQKKKSRSPFGGSSCARGSRLRRHLPCAPVHIPPAIFMCMHIKIAATTRTSDGCP